MPLQAARMATPHSDLENVQGYSHRVQLGRIVATHVKLLQVRRVCDALVLGSHQVGVVLVGGGRGVQGFVRPLKPDSVLVMLTWP